MRKRGLMIVLFLVLFSSSVCAWSTLTMPSPNSIYEGSVEAIRLSIDNFNKPQPIKEIQVTLPGVNITSVTLTPATLWQENHNGTFVRWFNDTVSTSSANDIFEFNAFVLPVLANTTVTLVVTKINQNGSNASENHTIILLNDTSAPFIVSTNPANNSNVFANGGNYTISVTVNESESQISKVTYSYCQCSANSTNCTANATTINLTCIGNICNGTADFSSFNEGDYACYAINASNNVGGSRSIFGRINFTGQPPQVTGITPATGSIYLVGDTVTIAANATDNQTAVDTVTATITYPNGTINTISLTKSGDRHSKNFVIPDLTGWYNITFIANDTTGNINNTQITQFKAVPVYNISFTLNPTSVRPGRTVRAAGTAKLANGSDIPETKVTVVVRGTETNATLTNGSFSHTFSAPNSAGNYNIEVLVRAANGYNYSSTQRLRVQTPVDYTTGYGGDGWEGGTAYVLVEEEGTADEEPTPAPEPEDAGVAKAPEEPEPEPSAEQVIEEILNKPETNQITGSAVGLGGTASLLALLLLVLGVATLAYSNAKIRGHVHKFAKEKVGGRFKKKEEKNSAFSDEEWEEYFRRLRED